MVMRGRFALVSGLAILVLASFAPPSHAATLAPISWAYHASVCDCETSVDVEDSSDLSPAAILPQAGSANWPPPDLENSIIDGNAAVTISNFPAILTTVALSQSNNPFDPLGRAQAYGEMTYQFEVSPIDGTVSGGILSVPVLFNGTYSGGISPTTGGDTVTGVSMNVTSTLDNAVLYSLTPGGAPGSYGGTLDIIPGVVYSVFMSASAVVEQTTGGASAAIDPNFSIDPAFSNLFQIQFSPGIQNAVATTPIPAALPLFASALGGLGLIGWRRKRGGAQAA